MKGFRKHLLFVVYVLVVSAAILEIGIRLLSKENPAHVELFLNKKHRYMLPLPTDPEKFQSSITSDLSLAAYRVYDDTLGWSHGTWGQDQTDFSCYSNDKGMRITKEQYELKDSSKKHYNILTIGDSFTHGDAVSCEESWPYLIEKKTGKTVGNLGVGGYGIQQALLRLMHSGITADTVLFGVIWGDLERAIQPVYTFYSGDNKTKPYIKFDDNDNYQLVNVPVLTPEEFYAAKKLHQNEIFDFIPGFNEHVFSDALWTNSYLMRLIVSIKHQKEYYREKPIYLSNDVDFEYCIKIFKLFDSYCSEQGIYGKIVLLDTGQNIVHVSKWNLDNPWTHLSSALTEAGIDHVDFHNEIYSAFRMNRQNVIHPNENLHYSAQGNNLVAELLIEDLKMIHN